jgi:large subunit ribosomal protein L18
MDKIGRRLRRKKGIRKKIHGTSEVPRLSVSRSNRSLYVQAIDDSLGRTIAASSSRELGVKGNTGGAEKVGENFAGKLKTLKVRSAVFDRNGYVYHGIVRALAEGIRKGGIRV